MYLGFEERSGGPSMGATSSSTAAVTERRLPFASASSASLTSAERLDFRRLANSLSASSSCSGSLNETVRIGFAMVIPFEHKGITRRGLRQRRPPTDATDQPHHERAQSLLPEVRAAFTTSPGPGVQTRSITTRCA